MIFEGENPGTDLGGGETENDSSGDEIQTTGEASGGDLDVGEVSEKDGDES